MRVYLALTVSRLRLALAEGRVESDIGFAVTPALREWYVEGDVDELEYVAGLAAARASLRLLVEDTDQPRRVVLAADVPDAGVRPAPDIDRAAVRLGEAVPITAVECGLIDDPTAADDVRRAGSALPPADAGDVDAAFVVEALEDHELCWYAVQELPAVVAP